MYLCITYGIIKIEIYSCNKELYTYKVAWFSLSYCLSVQRLENPKMSIVYHGAPTYIYICDTLPLDNPKTHSHLALPYITWGLIWDFKIQKKESLVLKKIYFLPDKCLESQKQKSKREKSQLKIFEDCW